MYSGGWLFTPPVTFSETQFCRIRHCGDDILFVNKLFQIHLTINMFLHSVFMGYFI